MKLHRIALAILFGAALCLSAGAADQPLKFEEVFSLIRSNLTELSDEELSRIAAEGLLKQLGDKVRLGGEPPEDSAAEAVARKAIFSDEYGYIRVERVNSNLPAEFKSAFESLTSTNSLKGLAIDLRFAEGQDYQAAADTAALFLKSGQVMFKAGGLEIRGSSPSTPISLPVAVLVNGQTSGAAEALAAVLRELEAALVIGSPTAGEARMFETFPLSTGQELRLGSIPVLLPDGAPIPSLGLRPDIAVAVESEAEQAYYDNPFAQLPVVPGGNGEAAASTNRLRPVMSEAELMRRHREGINIDPSAELIEDEPSPRVVMDPALARGLDFLKGVSVLRQFRPL